MSLFVLGCPNQVGCEDYQNNPFQFPFPVPEYYLKADIENVTPNYLNNEHMIIDVFNTKFSVDKNYADEVIKKNDYFTIKKSGKKVFIIMIGNEKYVRYNNKMRTSEKDFNLAFLTTKKYLEKIFLLTPDDLPKEEYLAIGNRWIVHNKSNFFKGVEKIKIYKAARFEAFRIDFKPLNDKAKVDLRIFQIKDPDKFLIFVFMNRNESLIEQILSTLY